MNEQYNKARNRIEVIRASGLFDEASYAFLAEARLKNQDPVLHYLIEGEARGGRPSWQFDPVYYQRRYGLSGDNLLLHYIVFGRTKGLRPLPISTEFACTTGEFRGGFRRSLLIVPTGQQWTECVLRLLEALKDTLDVTVVFLDQVKPDRRFESTAASLMFPTTKLEPEWEQPSAESAYFARNVIELHRPSSVICLGDRGSRLAQRFAAQFFPVVTLVPEDCNENAFDRDMRRFQSSAAVVFASEKIQANHMRRYPWLASRRTAVVPFLSSAAKNVETSAKVIASELAEGERRVAEAETKFRKILKLIPEMHALPSLMAQPAKFKQQLRENCTIGCLSTGGAPEFAMSQMILGFDRRRYASARQIKDGNPVLDYLIEGRLSEFRRRVIRPDDGQKSPTELRVALHGHYFYTDLAEELFLALAPNQHPIELFLSTDTDVKARALAEACARHGLKAEIRILPNRGRDIGPLLTGFRELFTAGYDVIGHTHGKRTPHLKNRGGDSWRQLLLQHIIGGRYAMADTVLTAFASDECLGLVFPETEQTMSWDHNIPSATRLAEKMNVSEALSLPTFDFPAGSFFWCRPKALRPLLDLNLDWHDYPDEPIGNDGTTLHAIERLLTFACEAAGFGYATTFVAKSK